MSPSARSARRRSDAYWATIVATFATRRTPVAAGRCMPPERSRSRRRTGRSRRHPGRARSGGAGRSARRRAERPRRQRARRGRPLRRGLRSSSTSAARRSRTLQAATMAAAIGDYGSAAGLRARATPVGRPTDHRRRGARALDIRRWSTSWSTRWRRTAPWPSTRIVPGRRHRRTGRERLADRDRRDVAGRQIEGLDGEVHPGVVALLAARPTGGDADDTSGLGPRARALHGPAQPDDPTRPNWFEQRVNASIGPTQASLRRCSSAGPASAASRSACPRCWANSSRAATTAWSVSPTSTTCAATDAPEVGERYDAPMDRPSLTTRTAPPGVATPASARPTRRRSSCRRTSRRPGAHARRCRCGARDRPSSPARRSTPTTSCSPAPGSAPPSARPSPMPGSSASSSTMASTGPASWWSPPTTSRETTS